MAEIVYRSVTRTFAGSVRALDGLSLTVADGEFVVVVGPSGCGKTTLLRVLAGLDVISGGEITLNGEPMAGRSPRDRDLAMVFQNHALYPHLTVFGNIAFGLRKRGLGRAETKRRVGEIAERLNIAGLLRRKPRALSGGQRQRAALARALARRPRAFLLDEPLSNLDAGLRVEMRSQLKAIQREFSVTTLLVTHDQEEAMTLGHRVAVMCEGRIRQHGPPLDVYASPADRFVAGFVGSPAMNFIDGRIASEDGSAWFEVGSRRIPLAGRLAGAVAEYAGRRLVLGVRPGHLRLAAPAGTESGLAARVIAVEPLGDRKDVHVLTQDAGRLVARIDASIPVTEAADVVLMIDPASVQMFEPGPNGRNVLS